MKINWRLTITIIAIVAGLGGIYFLAFSVVPRVLTTLTKAAPATKVSISNSLVLGAKILAKADGQDSCVVNVFLLDESGKGVNGKSVDLTGPASLKIQTIGSLLTNGDGKVSFEIKSSSEGQFDLTATTDGVSLPRGVTVTFRNQ